MGPGAAPEFAEVYEAYHGKVLSYVTRLLGRDEAEDVAQEIFIKIDRSLATLSEPAKLSSWVYAVTLNTVRDVARRRAAAPDRVAPAAGSARDEAEEDAPLSGLAAARSRTPEQDAIRSEMVACYLDYVRQLPLRYQEVYVLSEFEDLSGEEIARRLSQSPGAVKIRLHRARTRLNDELRHHCRCYHDERGVLMGEPKDR